MSTSPTARPPAVLHPGVERRPARPRRQHVAAPLPAEHAALLSALGVDIRAYWPAITASSTLVLVLEQSGARIRICTADRVDAAAWIAGLMGPVDDIGVALTAPSRGATIAVGVDGVWRALVMREPPPVEASA